MATPLGNARDITLRALDILASAEVLAAEDTRRLRHLLQLHAIDLRDRPILAYHDHNGAAMRPRLLRHITEGRSVAYTSDAGTPLLADPGFALSRAAIEQGLAVTTAPGPSAITAALTIAGLPTDRFLFAGFPPTSTTARRTWLTHLGSTDATLVIFEAPKRIHRTLGDMCELWGDDRQMALCREVTKRFEEVRRGSIAHVAAEIDGVTLRGEIVLLIDRDRRTATEDDMENALQTALLTMSVKDAAAHVAIALNLPRRQVYQAALAMDKSR